jgi:hypothetical protein
MVVADWVRRVLELSTNDIGSSKCLLFFLPPCEIFLATTLGHLVEGPCNMGESQHELSIEFGKSQEATKIG